MTDTFARIQQLATASPSTAIKALAAIAATCKKEGDPLEKYNTLARQFGRIKDEGQRQAILGLLASLLNEPVAAQ